MRHMKEPFCRKDLKTILPSSRQIADTGANSALRAKSSAARLEFAMKSALSQQTGKFAPKRAVWRQKRVRTVRPAEVRHEHDARRALVQT
eukprot:6201039-Pleurochrysis_carterae.AAC.2